MTRLTDHFSKAVWLNPVPASRWGYTHSTLMLKQLMAGRMFPLSLEGLEGAMKALAR
jgi:uncharacterized protein with von Willebrand factor type A (vWA) domain